MSNLTHEQIVEIFRQSRERKEKERQREALRKALEKDNKLKARLAREKREKEAQRKKEEAEQQRQWKASRTIDMSDWILKDSGELYTEYELRHIEELYPRETGRLSDKFWQLIEEAREKWAK